MQLRIMVVEDNPLHRKLYEAWLNHVGHEPIMVSDERNAQATALKMMPHVVVVDIRLPYIHGLDVIKGLKAAALTDTIPIVAVTVLSGQEDEDACLAAGADKFITKPIQMGCLLEAIQGLAHPSTSRRIT